MKLSIDEIKTLEQFCEQAETLANLNLFDDNQLAIQSRFEYRDDIDLESKFQELSNDELLPIVTILRQLYNRGDALNFKTVFGIVSKYLKKNNSVNENTMLFARSAMGGYKQVIDYPVNAIRIGSNHLKTIEIIEMWIGGNNITADTDNVKKYNSLWKSPAGRMAETNFKIAIANLASIMIYFGNLIRTEILNNI